MFSFLSSIIQFFMYWMFMYVCAILLLVFGITYLAKTNPTTIINHHYSTVQVIEPPKRVLIEEEICTRLDGCPIVNNVCVDCLTVKNQWGLITGDDGLVLGGLLFDSFSIHNLGMYVSLFVVICSIPPFPILPFPYKFFHIRPRDCTLTIH